MAFIAQRVLGTAAPAPVQPAQIENLEARLPAGFRNYIIEARRRNGGLILDLGLHQGLQATIRPLQNDVPTLVLEGGERVLLPRVLTQLGCSEILSGTIISLANDQITYLADRMNAQIQREAHLTNLEDIDTLRREVMDTPERREYLDLLRTDQGFEALDPLITQERASRDYRQMAGFLEEFVEEGAFIGNGSTKFYARIAAKLKTREGHAFLDKVTMIGTRLHVPSENGAQMPLGDFVSNLMMGQPATMLRLREVVYFARAERNR